MSGGSFRVRESMNQSGEDGLGQIRLGQDMRGQDRTDQVKIGSDRSGQVRMVRTGQVRSIPTCSPARQVGNTLLLM